MIPCTVEIHPGNDGTIYDAGGRVIEWNWQHTTAAEVMARTGGRLVIHAMLAGNGCMLSACGKKHAAINGISGTIVPMFHRVCPLCEPLLAALGFPP